MKGTGTHCCLVSEELIPNIIPLLDLKTRPRHVELLIPGDMHAAARPILRLCQELGIKVQQHAISAWNSDVIRDVLQKLLSTYAKSAISLNVSGGFRLLALEAFKAFSEEGREIFFIDTRHDRRVMLYPGTHPGGTAQRFDNPQLSYLRIAVRWVLTLRATSIGRNVR